MSVGLHRTHHDAGRDKQSKCAIFNSVITNMSAV